MLTEKELERYKRQLMLIREDGQERLRKVDVLIAGAGGLGSSVSLYLAAAGIGRIRIVDHNTVKLDNLNRQVLYEPKDIGKKKATCAKERLSSFNPHSKVDAIAKTITEDNVNELVANSHGIVDTLDNWPSRYILNQAAIANKIPLFHGAAEGFYGQLTTIIPGDTACLKCIFPVTPPPAVFPIIGGICGIIGSLQAMEVIKYFLGSGIILKNKLLILDELHITLDEISVKKNPECDCNRNER